MPEELHLVTELAIILVAAGVFTIISKALKQPLILGYIIAGFIVGPHLGLFPQFSADSIHEWSELGIIFLLFGLGLEFSFKKLLKIGSSALITAGVKCMGMFVVGVVTGTLLGWTAMESVFLGGLIGMSSTTIILKAYDDLGLKKKPYATLVFGSLVFEDLIAVLMLVLLSTIAVTGQFSGTEMLMALAKLIFFLILWFLVGIFVIPTVFRKAKRFLSDEILLLTGIGLCFLMVVLANLAGFSSALGAFVMGSILAETLEGERIEHLTGKIKDLFGAIFFVSVGMMLDPAVIAQYWGTILVLTLVVICGVLVLSTTGALLAGKGLDTAVHTSCSLAILGEFGFIIAGLGTRLDVMRDFIYPVVIAVSVVTTFTIPYMIKLGDPAFRFLQRKLPPKILEKLLPARDDTKSSKAEKSEWGRLLKNYILRFVLYGVILTAIVLGSRMFLSRLVLWMLPKLGPTAVNWICAAVTLVVMLPLVIGMNTNSHTINSAAKHLLQKDVNSKWALLALVLFRLAVASMFVLAMIASYFGMSWIIALIVIASIIPFILLSKRIFRRFANFERTFMENFNEREAKARLDAPVTSRIADAMAGYDIKLQRITVGQDMDFIGKSLRELPFRSASGVNIVKILRGNRSIPIPSGKEVVFPGDELLVVGTAAQMEKFNEMLSGCIVPSESGNDEEFVVESIRVAEESPFTGKTLREMDLRSAGCMVVGVAHNGSFKANPDADFCFADGDIVWLAGDKSAVEWYR